MTQYYFVTSSLPALRLGEEPDITFEEFMALARENLSSDDFAQVRKIQELVDLYNLCALWRGESLDRRGGLSKIELEELDGFPGWVKDFCDRYESREERVHHHGYLVAHYFQEAVATSEGFLRDYFVFEREWRLVMLGFRSKALGRDVTQELQYEDPRDPLVAQIIAQRDAPEFEPPEGYEALKESFEKRTKEPLELHRDLEIFRFQRVDSMVQAELFSLDYVLGYMVQLMICERLWEIGQ